MWQVLQLEILVDLRLPDGPRVRAIEGAKVPRQSQRHALPPRRVGREVPVVPRQAEIDAVGAGRRRDVVAVDLLRAVERSKVDEGPATLERVERPGAGEAADRETIDQLITRHDLVPAVAERQQVMESDP